jgi:hypothetical protein
MKAAWQPGSSKLLPKFAGIDDFEKTKTVKVCISSADLSDSVRAHQDGGIGVVEQVAGKVRNFADHLRDIAKEVVEHGCEKAAIWRRKEEAI